MGTYHTSVLLDEVVNSLAVKPGKQYIDATLGGGGHAAAIQKSGGIVLGIDRDQEAGEYVRKHVSKDIVIAKGNFSNIDRIAKEHGFTQVAGVLFDLGVSSHQLDTPERGFSFQKNGPLDMRMDVETTVRAADLINGLNKQELSDLFFKLGEEYRSRAIANAIVREREKKPIETTEELEKIIRHEVGGRYAKGVKHTSIHPATKVFQALRIVINDELHSLEEALPKAVSLLENRGRLVVISFHSLEDRIVKHAFKEFERKRMGRILTDKPVVPTEEEIRQNPRARSSKMRVFEKDYETN